MKRKIIIISLFMLLFIPINANAYTYKEKTVTSTIFKNNGFIKDWPSSSSVPSFYVGPNSSVPNTETFKFVSAVEGQNNYVGYISNAGKGTGNDSSNLERIKSFNTLQNNTNNLSIEQKELLEDLLINGYHLYDLTNTKPISQVLTDKTATLNMMAMQILVWEVMEGGRTSFARVEPNGFVEGSQAYNNSFYKKLVEPNGSKSENGTLYFAYYKLVENVKLAIDSSSSTAFNTDLYPLTWDRANSRYIATISGLGKYTTCSSSDSSVNVTVSGSSGNANAYINTTSPNKTATITCKYAVGTGTNTDFYYYKFNSEGLCANNSCSNILHSSAVREYVKSFSVTTKTADIQIKNKNIKNENLSGSKFRLTFSYNASNSDTYEVNANATDKTTIAKSGEYIVSQISVPKGYEKISDFNINIDTANNTVRDCTNSGIDSSGNKTCMNGRIVIKKESNTIVLDIVSLEKNFKIVKINENKDIIKGTTFQIKDSNNSNVKFKLVNGLFTYDNSGTENIYMENSGTYAIAMLPSGKYSVIETNAPSPYRLPTNEKDRTTKIQIDSQGDLLILDEAQNKYVTALNSSIQIKNYRTILKLASVKNGSTVSNVSHTLFDSTKTRKIVSKLDQEGVYSYLDNQSSTEGTDNYISNSAGYIHIYDLPIGTYYLQVNDSDSANKGLIEIKIDIGKDGATVNGSKVTNTMSLSADKNSFSFYKTDEEGNYLSGGSFKLQRYDSTKSRFVDLRLIEVENDGTYNPKANVFRAYDEIKDKNLTPEQVKKIPRQISLTNGIATFIDMKSSSEYRIVETKPPKGYVLQKVSDTASVTIDESGNAFGLLVLTNKQVSAQLGQAQAELIINIDTGQSRIKYAIIIGSIIVIIGLLLVLQKKKK